MSELTWHTGTSGSRLTINVDWFDHNNVPQRSKVVIDVLPQDKPRTLAVAVNGATLATILPEDY